MKSNNHLNNANNLAFSNNTSTSSNIIAGHGQNGNNVTDKSKLTQTKNELVSKQVKAVGKHDNTISLTKQKEPSHSKKNNNSSDDLNSKAKFKQIETEPNDIDLDSLIKDSVKEVVSKANQLRFKEADVKQNSEVSFLKSEDDQDLSGLKESAEERM